MKQAIDWEIVFMWARVFRYIILISFRFCTTLLLHGTSQTINKLHTNKATMKTINVKILLSFYFNYSIFFFLNKFQKTSEKIENLSIYNYSNFEQQSNQLHNNE